MPLELPYLIIPMMDSTTTLLGAGYTFKHIGFEVKMVVRLAEILVRAYVPGLEDAYRGVVFVRKIVPCRDSGLFCGFVFNTRNLLFFVDFLFVIFLICLCILWRFNA
jgi:hypothetical protein